MDLNRKFDELKLFYKQKTKFTKVVNSIISNIDDVLDFDDMSDSVVIKSDIVEIETMILSSCINLAVKTDVEEINATIFKINKNSEQLEICISTEYSVKNKNNKFFYLEGTNAGDSFKTKEVKFFNTDKDQNISFTHEEIHKDVKSYIYLPIINTDESVGVLYLNSTEENRFTGAYRDYLKFLTTLLELLIKIEMLDELICDKLLKNYSKNDFNVCHDDLLSLVCKFSKKLKEEEVADGENEEIKKDIK